MTYEQWKKKHSFEYRGYVIRPGAVLKDNEPVVIFHSPLDSSMGDVIREGKAIVDEREDKVS